MQIEFSKYEGAGNDFIMIDNRENRFDTQHGIIARLCDRHFGIGADGLMTLSVNAAQECSMRYYNADGSEGEMCGNGARCFALFMHHLNIGNHTKYFQAADGPHTAHLNDATARDGSVELGMIDVREIQAGDQWWFLNTGVPHYVEFVENIDTIDIAHRGHTIRHDTARFPQGTNVNFVQITGNGAFRMRTYERGVEAETLACGTGATAAAIIVNYVLQNNTDHYSIEVPGGKLSVQFSRERQTTHYTQIRLLGPAQKIFQGNFDTEKF